MIVVPLRSFGLLSLVRKTAVPTIRRAQLSTSRTKLQTRSTVFDTTPSTTHFQATARSVDTAKDVVLYSFDRPRFFKFMTLFLVAQFVFWAQMGHFSLQNFKRLRRREKAREVAEKHVDANGAAAEVSRRPDAIAHMDSPVAVASDSMAVKPEPVIWDLRGRDVVDGPASTEVELKKPAVRVKRWYDKFVVIETEDRMWYSFFTGLGYVFLGASMAYAGCFFALRSVKLVILRKGGQKVYIRTFAPFGLTRDIEVPIDSVSTRSGRQGVTAYLPLRIRKRPLPFLMDMRGKFHNPALFDVTAGLRRSWLK